MNIETLTPETIMADDVFFEILEEKDIIFRDKLISTLTDKAKMLSVKSKFESRLKAYLQDEKKSLSEQKLNKTVVVQGENYTQFYSDYLDLYCGSWIADENGVRSYNMFGEVQACYHPILPIERLRNAETDTEKIRLAFKKGNYWREITVDKDVIASNNKIIGLSNLGVSVTSENSRYLVKYLADVENANYDIIPERISTSKMGWISGEFLPYTNTVAFDGNDRFKTTFDAISEKGDYQKWLDLVLKYRKKGRPEFTFVMAASFASVLVKPLEALPFWCNIYGGTGAGKTVAEMVATSIWACPEMGKYMIDFKNTDVAVEVRQDFLNNLPLFIDDTANAKEKLKENFSSMVYDMCSGKGKGRSNRSLGMNKETTWKNVIISSGENPLSSENLQGGALNRILDLEASDIPIFESGQDVAALITNNYGFAGKMFVEAVMGLGIETIKEIQTAIFEEVSKMGKMEKQSLSLSILLTADRIATDFIFKDGVYIDLDKIKGVLLDKSEVSENERCYDFILGEVAINESKFTKNQFGENSSFECWGTFDEGYVIIIKNIFDKICKSGGYSSRGFLNWADKKGHLLTSKTRKEKQKRFGDYSPWCVYLKLKPMDLDTKNAELPFDL